MRLTETVDKPELIGPNYLSTLRGMLYDSIASKCMAYTEEVRSFLFKSKNGGHGIDLMSLDLMRGRDVGIQPYVKCFERCVGITIRCWCDLEPFISYEYWPLLREIYEHVEDIDLLVGVLAEKRVHGLNGAIGACIFAEQFHSFKYGNRFYYEFEGGPHSFTTGKYIQFHLLIVDRCVNRCFLFCSANCRHQSSDKLQNTLLGHGIEAGGCKKHGNSKCIV